MEAIDTLTVLPHNPEYKDVLRPRSAWRVLRRVDPAQADARNIFVLVAASELLAVADFIREANRRHHLRALLVHADVDPLWVLQMFERADLRTLRNTLVHDGPEIPRRVLNAWRLGAQDHLIAQAQVIRSALLVQTCALDRLEIPLDAIPALARLSEEQRAEFKVADDGSYLHWPEPDVHLDLEALRLAGDPEAREQARRERVRRDERFAAAVATLRKRRGLRQSDIHGVSARQVRRIESGSSPRTATLNQLAAAHGVDLDSYLAEIAEVMRERT